MGRMHSSLRAVALSLVLVAMAATPAAAAGRRTPAGTLPPLTLSRTHVHPGQSFVVTGSHCVPPPGTEAFFEVEARGRDVGFGGGGDGVPGGHWGIALTVPAHTAPGVLRITAQCDLATGKVQYPRAKVFVEPTHAAHVGLSKHRARPGAALTVRASGFFAFEHLVVSLHGVGLLAVVTTDRTGAATAPVHVPRGAPTGDATVKVAGRASQRTATAGLIVLSGSRQRATGYFR